MANNKLIINEKQMELGNFIVGRLLPFRQKRQVGPITFVDHMGPSMMGNGSYIDVDQHPHIGLSTLTYMFEGEIEHKDSTGAQQVIKPGDVGFMTSGKGVAHTERTPQTLRDGSTYTMHGYQFWVSLPVEKEEIDPNFQYYTTEENPEWVEDGVHIKLVAGNAFGKSAPLQGYSPFFIADIRAKEETVLSLGGKIEGEVGFIIVNGSIMDGEEEISAGQLMISKSDDQCQITLKANTKIILFGGEALPEEHFLLWNFVSHSKERLEQAKEAWINKAFPKVPDDTTYIPFPVMKKK